MRSKCVREPLIFSGPGTPKGERRSQFAYLLDIYSKLCEWIGAPLPDSVEGRSLVPVLHNARGVPGSGRVIFAYTNIVSSIKYKQYKLIEYAGTGNFRRTQLFNPSDDPAELNEFWSRYYHQSAE
ncbi:MAG: sulfatase [Paenibacillus sp.]|nr:sulfatase [Paenibacillus sp.]